MNDPSADTAPRFLAELRRRRVPRALLVYGAAAFAVLQAADILVAALHLPGVWLTVVTVALLFGAPLAAVMAWFYEITPEGLRRTTAPAGAAGGIHPWLSARTVALAALLLVIGLGGGWLARPRPMPAPAGLGPRSIAVLPFANLGADPDAEAFAAGIHDDLLTHLYRVEELRVISRTSVLGYAGTTRTIRDIARELGVASVLEGGVQRAGSRVRINVQLIDAATDAHLWAEQYDRELTAENVFAIQSEIATAVVTALQATLTADARSGFARVPTANLTAYELYARALGLHGGRQAGYRRDLMLQRARMLEQAVNLDSSFAQAWAALGMTRAQVYFFHYDRSPENVRSARAAIDRALALRPDLPEAFLALGSWHYWYDLDYERALAALERARRGLPGSGVVLGRIAAVHRRQRGHVHEAVAELERARDLDPRSGGIAFLLAETYRLVRRYDDALAEFDRALALDPALDDAHIGRADTWLRGRGDVAAARRELAPLADGAGGEYQVEHYRALVEIYDRNWDAALRVLETSGLEAFGNQFYYVPRALLLGVVHAARGDTAGARDAFEAALAHLAERLRADSSDVRYRGASALALAGLGRRDEAIRTAERAAALLPMAQEAWRGAWRLEELARVYAAAGERDRAIELLERLTAEPTDVGPGMLRLDPAWDPLRTHPRFRALLRS